MGSVSRLSTLMHLDGLDPAVQRSFRREQLAELSLPLAFSLMEGGFVGVVAAKAFQAPAWVIAVISAAPMFGNLSSFIWNRLAAARPKVPMLTALHCSVLLCVLAIALSPGGDLGTWIVMGSVVLSRLLIAGIVTVRSVIWSLNYERSLRARATARLQGITSLMLVLTTTAASLMLDSHPEHFRWIFAAGLIGATAGVWTFRGVMVQGERRHQVLERRTQRDPQERSGFFAILRADRRYARYQLYQFISGAAAMALEAPLVLLVTQQIGASYFASIGVVMLIPFVLNLATLPLWARYLDRIHVVVFRAQQNALWVLGVLVMFIGAWQLSLTWLVIGRILTGILNGGGTLAWQLGHNDFAPRDQLSAYMGVHVTLTGVRGAFAPFLGMALYVGWAPASWLPGSGGMGPWLFALSALLGVVAWRGFARLAREIGPRI